MASHMRHYLSPDYHKTRVDYGNVISDDLLKYRLLVHLLEGKRFETMVNSPDANFDRQYYHPLLVFLTSQVFGLLRHFVRWVYDKSVID